MSGRARLFAIAAVVFALGWAAGSRPGSAPSAAPAPSYREGETRCPVAASEQGKKAIAVSSDRLALSASSAASAEGSASDPGSRARLEKLLLSVPYAELKRIFLQRQDDEFTKTQERYGERSALPEGEVEKRSNELAERFRASSGGRSYYLATAEWKLRGGRTTEVEIHTNFYAYPRDVTMSDPPRDASAARNGRELNQMTALYVKVGDHYASEGSAAPMDSVSLRNGVPYILLQSYSKELAPEFDQVSIPLPVIGEDGTPELYDSTQGTWTALPQLRWTAVDKDVFDRREAELRDARRSDD